MESLLAVWNVDLLVAALIAIFSGVIHGYTGFGAALFMVPLFSLLFGPVSAIAIASIVALFGSALLAIALPWYAFNEPDRQAEAAEAIVELDVEEGEHWFSTDGFGCADCHGAAAGGGAALK